MIVTFIGNSKIDESEYEDISKSILVVLEKEVGNSPVTFYLGGYGNFDWIAKESCNAYKKTHPGAKTIFITPYLDEQYLKNHDYVKRGCDEILYPPLETTPKRLAIIKRNFWMMKQADLVILHVRYSCEGAGKTLEYAEKIKKRIIKL